MRKILGILLATAVAASSVSAAYAGCHGGAGRSYQEFERFLLLAPKQMKRESEDLIAEIDNFFLEKYPQGQLPVDPSQLTEAEIAAQQAQVIADYKWLQAKLVTLRERGRAGGASDEALGWLAYVELPIVYGTEQGRQILTEDLPKLASFSFKDDYPVAKYDAVVQACATSLEKVGQFHVMGSEDFFVACGQIQPPDKRQDGHMQLTHAIYDNVTALKAYAHDRQLEL